MNSTRTPGEAPSTLQVMSALTSSQRSAPARFSFCTRLSGKGLNPHFENQDTGHRLLLTASKKKHGLSTVVQEYLSKNNRTTSQTWLTWRPLFITAQPELIQQLIVRNGFLFDGETGGIQERFFGKGTIISLKKTDPGYAPQRTMVMRHLFTNLSELAEPMQEAMNPYFHEIKEAKEAINLGDFAARIALANIGILVGFDKDSFIEADKTALARVVHDIVSKIPNPLVTIRINIENAIKNLTGKAPNLVPNLDILSKEGENIIKRVISRNPAKVLEQLKKITGKHALALADLYTPNILSLIKLFLIGGFETTTKLLQFSMLMLGDANNSKFIEKMREEISALNKHPDKLTKEDLNNLPYLRAFIFEVLRLYPPFSHMRHTVEQAFTFAQNISLSTTKKECKEKINDPRRDTSEDLLVPAGSIIITSPFDAHRSKALYGEDAEAFNPSRWLGKSFSLRDLMTRLDFFTFGNDARACPGRIFSEQEAMIFIARLIAGFEISHNLDMPLPLEVGFTLEMKPGITAKGIFTSIPEKRRQIKESLTSVLMPSATIDDVIIPYVGLTMPMEEKESHSLPIPRF